MLRKFKLIIKKFKLRKKYSSGDREPFYDLAGAYLPSDVNAHIVDIGSGDNLFARHLKLFDKYKNIHLLDKFPKSEAGVKAKTYNAPDRLFFDDSSVDYIHCSHLVEHLYPNQLVEFMNELDRVLKNNGILIISAPMYWERFYDDLSHIKPYNPKVFINYLCQGSNTAERSNRLISSSYIMNELIFRYRVIWGDDLVSKYLFVNIIVKVIKYLFVKMGYRKYIKNGFTIVLKKKV